MKRIFITLAVAATFSVSALADNAKVTIYADQGTQKIHKEIYGQFAEHLGSCIYGGLWVGENSQIPNINGYRKDSPRIEKEIESISIGKPKKGLCPDNWLDTEFFIIKFK